MLVVNTGVHAIVAKAVMDNQNIHISNYLEDTVFGYNQKRFLLHCFTKILTIGLKYPQVRVLQTDIQWPIHWRLPSLGGGGGQVRYSFEIKVSFKVLRSNMI